MFMKIIEIQKQIFKNIIHKYILVYESYLNTKVKLPQ